MTIYTLVKVVEDYDQGYLEGYRPYGLGSFKDFKDAVKAAEDLGFEMHGDLENLEDFYYILSKDVKAKNWTSVRYELEYGAEEYILITETELEGDNE